MKAGQTMAAMDGKITSTSTASGSDPGAITWPRIAYSSAKTRRALARPMAWKSQPMTLPGRRDARKAPKLP
ncbi:MAG: hypothetical protein E6I60_16340 [Chloroflexi bacterium]|nr:MAG: hypothetical protein E6I60_16340 [Chloroflexota bacterium]